MPISPPPPGYRLKNESTLELINPIWCTYLVYIQHPKNTSIKTLGHYTAKSEDHAINQAKQVDPKTFTRYVNELGGEAFAEAQGYA